MFLGIFTFQAVYLYFQTIHSTPNIQNYSHYFCPFQLSYLCSYPQSCSSCQHYGFYCQCFFKATYTSYTGYHHLFCFQFQMCCPLEAFECRRLLFGSTALCYQSRMPLVAQAHSLGQSLRDSDLCMFHHNSNPFYHYRRNQNLSFPFFVFGYYRTVLASWR